MLYSESSVEELAQQCQQESKKHSAGHLQVEII